MTINNNWDEYADMMKIVTPIWFLSGVGCNNNRCWLVGLVNMASSMELY